MTTEHLTQLIGSQDAQEFLQTYLDYDPKKLLFKFSQDEKLKALAIQLAIKKKLAKKLPEWCNNSKTIFPIGVSPEQASSEVTAKLKASLVSGDSLLDVTGGLGVDSYYFSKVFNQVFYVEKQTDLSKVARHNFGVLGSRNISVSNENGLDQLVSQKTAWAYVDPARRGNQNQKLVSLSDCEPDVPLNLNALLGDGRKALIKTSPLLDISIGLTQLKYTEEVWVISHRNECKELVFLLNKEFVGPKKIRTFNIEATGNLQNFDFNHGEDQVMELAQEFGSYIYEANASIMKAAGGDHLSIAYGIKKLDANTNFYTSNERIENFPGKCFKIEEVMKPYHSSLKKGRFNVISRNYPDKASIIETRLKLKPSQYNYLIACKASFAHYVFIVAQQIKDI